MYIYFLCWGVDAPAREEIPMTEMTASRLSGAQTASEPPVYKYLSGGEWRSTEGTFPDFEPFTGEVFAEVADCRREDAAAAIAAAAGAFPAWARTTPAERADIFLAAADILESRRPEVADILAHETGACTLFANYQQTIVKRMLRKAAEWVYLPRGELLVSDHPTTRATAERRPLGVVASLTPWNGASVLGWRGLLMPLIWGNTVVSKPSELAPVSAGLIMAEILQEAGAPAGTVNILTHAPGAAGPIADEFFENPAVRLINFVGSVPTGRMLAERAGRALKRTVMELGGYNPLIVCADVDLDYAVRVAAFSAFFHQGQICTCARKIYVERPIYDEFVERFVARTKELPTGDPLAPDTIVGPLITPEAVAKVHERVEDAVARGAKVAAGGTFEGQVYEPTILLDVPGDAEASCDETFGPLVIVAPVDSAEEAVEDTNRSLYGLTASILSRDIARAEALGSQVISGIVGINVPTVHEEAQHPGGGSRDSGWGRNGPHSMADFTDIVKTSVELSQRKLPID
jgi:acyl-CoA reductase-like NAD-dependent aldehyde dehydrogenase